LIENKTVRVRFAPSPTGRTHLGSGRTALYNYLLAKQTGGKFILRIEDTDQKRYVPGAEEELMNSLNWLGLDWDEGPDVGGDYGPYRQTLRRDIYQKYARQLVEADHAYYCFCKHDDEQGPTDKKVLRQHRDICPDRVLSLRDADRKCGINDSYVIRFKMPADGSITIRDAIRGDITVENSTLDDYVLIKSDGLPVYHLAVVIDDHLMKITHAIRTSEWLPTFPLHGHIYRAFGWEQPIWIHPSIFLKPDGKGKMSKRDSDDLAKEGKSIFLGDMKDLGYLPEAVVNWAALMGWSYDDKAEFFTMADLIEKFSIEKLNPSPAAINFSKLDHFNGLHIRNLTPGDLAMRFKPFFIDSGYNVDDSQKLEKIAKALQNRLTTLAEAPEKAGLFFKDEISIDPTKLIGKNMEIDGTISLAERVFEIIQISPQESYATTESELRNLAGELGVKAGVVFGFLRDSTTGEKVTPPIFDTMDILGHEIVENRIRNTIMALKDYDIEN